MSESTTSSPTTASEPTITVIDKPSNNIGVSLIGFVCTALSIVGPAVLIITGWK